MIPSQNNFRTVDDMLTNTHKNQISCLESSKQTTLHLSSTTTTSLSTDKLTAGVSHIGLSVSDLEKSKAFFEAIGFKKIGGDDSYPSTFLSDGDSMITLW
jgi:catechol-2,3-dioxygenase